MKILFLFFLFQTTFAHSADDHEYFSRDEQIGLVALDAFFDYELGFAKELQKSGKANQVGNGSLAFYSYDNRIFDGRIATDSDGKQIPETERKIQSLRQPNFVEFIEIASGNGSDPVRMKYEFEALRQTKEYDPKETSGKILAALRTEIMKNENKLYRYSFKDFNRVMNNVYCKGVKDCKNFYHQLVKIYFTDERHPFHELSSLIPASEFPVN